MKQFICYSALVACIVALLYFAYLVSYEPISTIILVRHAERLNDTDTTSLSPQGRERASVLKHVLVSADVNRVYVTDKVRTGQTAQPTADLFNLTPSQITGNATDRFVDSIHAHRGKVIFIVGHSDTVPEIISKLGVIPPPAIPREVYDDLFVVTLSRFRAKLAHLKYGKPT